MSDCNCLCCRIKRGLKKIGSIAGSVLMVGMTMGGVGDSSRRSEKQ